MRTLFRLSDILTIAGLSLMGYGLYLFSPWVACVVTGALVMAGGLLMGRGETGGEES